MIRIFFAIGVVLAAPQLQGQEARQPARVGVLSVATERSLPQYVAGFKRFGQLGWIEGRNLEFDWQNAKGDMAALPALAADLLRRRSDVIVALGAEAPLKAAREATKGVPIVFLAIDYDPVKKGYIASLAKPGGNATGVSLNQLELSAKRMEILKAAFPKLKRVAVFWDPISSDQLKATQQAAARLGVAVSAIELGIPLNVEGAVRDAGQAHADALVILLSPLFLTHMAEMNSAALKRRLPTMWGQTQAIDAGGLISYGVDIATMWVLVADQVDRVLRGARPAELPVQQPTVFSFDVNLRTAKALGVTLPPATLARAERVLQ